MKYAKCPRCGEQTLDRFQTHSYCAHCNYDEIYADEFLAIPQWALEFLKTAKPKSIIRELRAEEQTVALESAV